MDAKPYREGSTWSMRRRLRGQNIYVGGLDTAGAAKKAMHARVAPLETRGDPKGFGPDKTTVAQAMQDYAVQRFPFLKGAKQEVNRFNRYLRAAGLNTLAAVPAAPGSTLPTEATATKVGGKKATRKVTHRHWDMKLLPLASERAVPQGLAQHRLGLANARLTSDALRAQLARTPMAKVMRHQVQDFFDALRTDGLEPATLQLERACLRSLFNHANTSWNWSSPRENPATLLKLPTVDNVSERVMSDEEQVLLDEALHDCRNQLVGPVLVLLRETAMRTSEPLEHAYWSDVNWQANTLTLGDAKTGRRDVPLSPAAISALKELQSMGSPGPEDRIVKLTYEALKAAWTRLCKRAGIEGLSLRDSRHTAATRMALKTGNVFLVKALTGHKTWSMVYRYVNVKAADVVAVMHANTTGSTAPELVEASLLLGDAGLGDGSESELVNANNVIRHDFRRARQA